MVDGPKKIRLRNKGKIALIKGREPMLWIVFQSVACPDSAFQQKVSKSTACAGWHHWGKRGIV